MRHSSSRLVEPLPERLSCTPLPFCASVASGAVSCMVAPNSASCRAARTGFCFCPSRPGNSRGEVVGGGRSGAATIFIGSTCTNASRVPVPAGKPKSDICGALPFCARHKPGAAACPFSRPIRKGLGATRTGCVSGIATRPGFCPPSSASPARPNRPRPACVSVLAPTPLSACGGLRRAAKGKSGVRSRIFSFFCGSGTTRTWSTFPARPGSPNGGPAGGMSETPCHPSAQLHLS